MTDPRLEAVARALCVYDGRDPDERVGLDTDVIRDGEGQPLNRSPEPTRYGPRWTSRKRLEEAGRFLAARDAAEKFERGETS